jgi:hypothetical protein
MATDMVGKGKYDDACTAAREATNAHTVVLIVMGHDPKDSGFSVQSYDPMIVLTLPRLLRAAADDIEKNPVSP